MQINWRSLNLRRIAIICASAFVFGVLFGYVAFPQLLKKMIGGVRYKIDFCLRINVGANSKMFSFSDIGNSIKARINDSGFIYKSAICCGF